MGDRILKKTPRHFATVPLALVIRKTGAKANHSDGGGPVAKENPAALRKDLKAAKRVR
jgi:hypothetical protein